MVVGKDVKFFLYTPRMGYRGSGNISPPILNNYTK
jgi:hypothetical protein